MYIRFVHSAHLNVVAAREPVFPAQKILKRVHSHGFLHKGVNTQILDTSVVVYIHNLLIYGIIFTGENAVEKYDNVGYED